MTQSSRATVAALIAELFPDNTEGLVSPEDLRDGLTELMDSVTWYDEQTIGGGDDIIAAVVGEPEEDRDGFLVDTTDGLVAAGELWKTKDDGTGVEGLEIVEEVIADPSDIAEGINTTLGTTIASEQFWRLRHSVAQADPLTLYLVGSSTTPSATNNTLNVRVLALTAAVTWQIAEIADGLEDVEGQITFINGEGNTNNCFPQNHATGADVDYDDGVVQGDLVVPTGVGSMLTVYYKIDATGTTSALFYITGFRKVTA
jgi:hypothetical protein